MTKGTMIHIGRNRLCTIQIDNVNICIKEYCKPNRINQFIYRFIRKPKGLRAWLHADILRQAGFNSPENIAYIQRNTFMGIGLSYYVCIYLTGKTLYRWGNQPLADIQDEIIQFAQLTARLHNAGLLLNDYTPGNILRIADTFSLIDTNRMQKGHISINNGLRNMAGLWLQPDAADLLTQHYIHARGQACLQDHIYLMRKYRKNFWIRFAKKHHITDIKVHQDVDGSKYIFNILPTIQ